MNSFKILLGKDFIKVKLSLLWLFVMLNYIYADILTLMDASALKEILGGTLGVTPLYLFIGAILMEIPIAMVFLSLMLSDKINRWANVVSGILKTLAVLGSLSVGTPSAYYTFFVSIEVITTVSIIVIAWRWNNRAIQSDTPQISS